MHLSDYDRELTCLMECIILSVSVLRDVLWQPHLHSITKRCIFLTLKIDQLGVATNRGHIIDESAR